MCDLLSTSYLLIRPIRPRPPGYSPRVHWPFGHLYTGQQKILLGDSLRNSLWRQPLYVADWIPSVSHFSGVGICHLHRQILIHCRCKPTRCKADRATLHRRCRRLMSSNSICGSLGPMKWDYLPSVLYDETLLLGMDHHNTGMTLTPVGSPSKTNLLSATRSRVAT